MSRIRSVHSSLAESSGTPAGSNSQLGEFARFCEARTELRFSDHAGFHEFSVRAADRFWSLLLEFSELEHEGTTSPVRTSDRCESAEFFPDVRLSYAGNLLRRASSDDDARAAIIACAPDRPVTRLTRGEVRSQVLSLAGHLRELGIGPGDRVVAMAGNNAEAVIGGLASVAVGATFSSGSPQMGVQGLLSRFSQLEPKLLLANAQTPEGRSIAAHLRELVEGLPTLRALIALDDEALPASLGIPALKLTELIDDGEPRAEWTRFPFNHPLFVLFTSGTTGAPKCLVHGAGGTLLEHVKEHRLHVDLRPGERLFFHSSAAWMMWNWQLSALSSGAELVLYDGPVTGPETLWELVRREQVNVFGTSPPYLQLCQDSGFEPGPLPQLRTVLSTGSILHDWQYDWVSDHVGPVALQSISGGTDIIGCFVLGNPDLPVRRGMIQCRSLGMDVQALPAEGEVDLERPLGELVCRNPFPSRPLGFYGDDGQQFHAAYFEQNPDVWTHGDLIEFEPDGQARMHGRSDGVLNVRGERIGPAEIYRALRGVEEVGEALAVQHELPDGDVEIALLIVLRASAPFDDRLVVRIRREVATRTSPAHVPALVVAVPALPVTHSGKRSERAARDAVNGRPVGNPQALANPESLAEITRAVSSAIDRRSLLEAVAGRNEDDSIERRVLAVWEAIFGIPLAPDDNFFELGGTSLLAVRLLQAIHDRIGVELPPAVFVYAPTPAELARLIDAPAGDANRILVPLRPGPHARPLFMAHSIAGDVLELLPLVRSLDTERPVYGLQAIGLDPAQTPQDRVEDMAETYIDVIRSVQPTGPYAVGGYSFGGLIAFEIARGLEARGEHAEAVVLLDPEVHHRCLPTLARWRFLARRPLRYVRYALAAPTTRFPSYVRKALARTVPALPIEQPRREPEPLPPRLAHLTAVGWRAFDAYRTGPYSGPVTVFLARPRFPNSCDPLPAWKRAVRGNLTVERIRGDHDTVLRGANLSPIARRISELLRETRD